MGMGVGIEWESPFNPNQFPFNAFPFNSNQFPFNSNSIASLQVLRDRITAVDSSATVPHVLPQFLPPPSRGRDPDHVEDALPHGERQYEPETLRVRVLGDMRPQDDNRATDGEGDGDQRLRP